MLTAVNNGRLKLYAPSDDPEAESLRQEFFHQARSAVYQLRANQLMSFFVPEHRGHDDLLNAAALVAQASPLGRLRTAAGRRQDRTGDR